MMESAAKPCTGDPVTSAEFSRVALTVAYALVNPCELICSSCLNISDQYQPDQTEWDVTRLADRVKNTRPRGDGEPAQDDINITKHFKNHTLGT